MNGLHYSAEDQEKVIKKIEEGVAASTQEAAVILKAINVMIYELNISQEGRMNRLLGLFAALVVSLAIRADRVQKWMIVLTMVTAALTLGIFALTVVLTVKP